MVEEESVRLVRGNWFEGVSECLRLLRKRSEKPGWVERRGYSNSDPKLIVHSKRMDFARCVLV
jgi:hypothetical protein